MYYKKIIQKGDCITMICTDWRRRHISNKIILKRKTDVFGPFYFCPNISKCKYCDGLIGEDNHMWRLFERVERLREDTIVFENYVLKNYSIIKWM